MDKKLTIASLITALALIAASPSKADIVIGIAAPLTGVYAPLGQQLQAGAEQAAREINETGGLSGEDVTIETVNDQCRTETAKDIANQLVGKDVIAVIGHICDRPSIEAASVYTENEIIQISPASQNPAFTDNRPNDKGGTYRLDARNTQQADVLASFLNGAASGKRLAILNDGSV